MTEGLSEGYCCWRCSAPLINLILPMSRREECSSCGADQHVCMLCLYYSAASADQCTEDRAEHVTDKESANFCDYFAPQRNVKALKHSTDQQQTEVTQQLAELFGEEPAAQQQSEIETDANNGDLKAIPLSEAELARQELERLFEPEPPKNREPD